MGGGAWQERGGWFFWRGVDTPMHTMLTRCWSMYFARFLTLNLQSGSTQDWVLNLAKCPVEDWTGNLPVPVQHFTTMIYSPQGCQLNMPWIFLNPLRAIPTKWSNTLKQFVDNSQWIGWVCLTILWSWRLKRV